MLISGPRCGYRVPSSESVLPALSVAAKIASSNYKAALFRHGFDLAQSCFTNTTSNLPSTFNCDLYPKSSFRTQSSFTRGNHCPFATTDICLDLTKGTFRVDTGPLDSRQHFGINTRHDGDRLTVRKVMDCTPIRTQSYQTSWNYTDSVNSTLDFNYGHPAGHPNDPTTIKLPLMLLWHPQQPYTIKYVLRQSQAFSSKVTNLTGGHSITAFYPWNPQDSDFEPIPELHRDDADVNLILLQNHAKFLAEVDDPWFNASHVVGDPRAGGYYEYLDPVHVLGCTEQYEFCDPKSLTCTGLMSIGNVLDDQTISQFGFNPHQKTLAKHIGKLLSLFTLKALWTNLPSSYLLASTEVDPVSAYSSRLPSDQWTQEVKNWLRMMQIALQRSVIDYAAGPVNIGGDHFLSEPQMAFERDLCLSQIIHNSTYSSFSILGMVIIFVIGGLFIILDQLAPSLQKRLFRHRDPAVQDLWLFDDYLHLQQRAFEEAGVGKWYHRANSVPITYRPENFKPLRNARKTVVKLEVENMPSVAVFSPHIYDFAYLSNRINSRV